MLQTSALRRLRTACIVIVAVAWINVTPVFAQDLEAQKAALKEIRETANDICYIVQQHGQQTELTADVQGKTSGIIKKMIGAGVSASGALKTSWYQGVIREQLATTLNHSMDCKKDVFDTLVQLMITTKAANNPKSCPPGYSIIDDSMFRDNGTAISVPVGSKLCIVDTKFEGNGKGLELR